VEAARNAIDSYAPPIRGEDFSGLPDEVCDELRASVISLDARRISGAIQKVAELNPPLGEVLAHYASQYSYTAILAAVGWNGHRSAAE
jgi:hypothetical protein